MQTNSQFPADSVIFTKEIFSGKLLTKNIFFTCSAMKPKFITPPDDPIYLFRGMTMTIKCNVFGGPIPTVTWFKDGRSLKSQARFTQPDYRLLQIRNIRDSDEGVYRCMAENIYGKIDSAGNVKVLGNNFMKKIFI